MSIKDLIWVRVGQALYNNQKLDIEAQKLEGQYKLFDNAFLCMADIRTILFDTNGFARIAAMSNIKNPKLRLLDANTLPSVKTENERKEQETLAKMTPEERDLYLFNTGKKIRY